MAGVVLGLPAIITSLIQQGLLERAYHDGLYPNLAFRAEAMPEEWEGNLGQTMIMTRAGLLTPITQPLTPGVDPQPQALSFEQWVATLNKFAGAIDTHMPTSTVANGNLFLRNLKQLGLQAGQSINRVARNELFKAYLSGRTSALTAIGSGDTQVRVASLNGFTDVVIPGTNVAPAPVSSTTPLSVTLGVTGASATVSVIGAIPDNPNDPFGPGTLLLAAAVGTAFAAARTPVLSAYAPRQIFAAPGNTIDGISASDGIVLQMAINAASQLRRAMVQPHPDGFYHAHISATGNAQIFNDPVFQRLNQSLPEHVIYKEGFIGQMSGVLFFMNLESPETFNSGAQTNTTLISGNQAIYSQDIGAETVNGGGVPIGRMVVTGRGAIYEKYLDEGKFVTEAGTTGKIGEFDVVNNGLQILTERIRLVLRAPVDRLQEMVSAAWSISTCFPVPSDITAPSGPERYKRAIVCNYASS